MKLSVDMGHRYSKFFDGSKTKIILTILGEPQGDLMGDNNRQEIRTSEGHWYLGQTAVTQSLTHITGKDEEWASTPEYRALLLYGISEYLSPSTDSTVVDLVVSLPIVDYRRNRPALTKLLRKTHLVERPNRRKLIVTIRNLLWLPQGFAPAKPFLGDDKNVVALDFGSRNINYVQFNGQELINGKTDSKEVGAAQVIQDIVKRIQEQTGRELSEQEMMEVIQGKEFRVSGQPIDVSDIITERLGYYARFYKSFISDRWGSAKDIDTFVSFGGGAILAGQSLVIKYPQMVVLDDPQCAQARSMFDYLNRMMG